MSEVSVLLLLLIVLILVHSLRTNTKKFSILITALHELNKSVHAAKAQPFSATSNREPINPATTAVAISNLNATPVQLYYCTHDKQVVLGIKKMNSQKLFKANKKPIDIAESKLSNISPIIQAAPAILSHAKIDNDSYMEVVINGKWAAARPSGPLTPIVRGADGKLIEPAHCNVPTGLISISSTAAIWSTASIITNQKYFSGIEAKLSSLNDGFKDVREFLTTEREPVLTGAFSYLRYQAYPAVKNGELPPEVRSELENIERRLIDVQSQLTSEHENDLEQLKDIKFGGTAGSDKALQILTEHIQKIVAIRKQYVLAVKMRALCWRLFSIFAQDQALERERKSALLKATASEIYESTQKLIDAISERVNQIDVKNAKGIAFSEQKFLIKGKATEAAEATREELTRIRKNIYAISNQLAPLPRNIRLAVKLENGELSEAFELVE